MPSSSSSSSSSHSSSSSSPSYAPDNVVRRCYRLAEPNSKTDEQIDDDALSIYVTLPFDIVNRYASMIPSTGPDTLVISYTDYMGQAGSLTRSITFWMSDAGYVFLSADRGSQFLIAGVDGAFFDDNALNVNARNTQAGAIALLPCENASRYGANVLLANQSRPDVWIYDGVYINPSSSSSGG